MNMIRGKYPPFLGSETGNGPAESSMFHVIPVPLERSVSYGAGAKNGPSAILAASQQLEVYDGRSVPAEKGIHTKAPVRCGGSILEILARITESVADSIRSRAIPVVLGGEHTVTCGVFPAFASVCRDFGVVQFDAHADLRDSYEGDPYSHASAMKRVVDAGIPLFQIGIRSLSPPEADYRLKRRIPSLDAELLARRGIPSKILPKSFPENVYITFDIDVFNPALVPSTGTPEPGGIDWYAAMELLEKICVERNIVGFDVVELAPINKFHAPDFTAARLVYNLMGFITRKLRP